MAKAASALAAAEKEGLPAQDNSTMAAQVQPPTVAALRGGAEAAHGMAPPWPGS